MVPDGLKSLALRLRSHAASPTPASTSPEAPDTVDAGGPASKDSSVTANPPPSTLEMSIETVAARSVGFFDDHLAGMTGSSSSTTLSKPVENGRGCFKNEVAHGKAKEPAACCCGGRMHADDEKEAEALACSPRTVVSWDSFVTAVEEPEPTDDGWALDTVSAVDEVMRAAALHALDTTDTPEASTSAASILDAGRESVRSLFRSYWKYIYSGDTMEVAQAVDDVPSKASEREAVIVAGTEVSPASPSASANSASTLETTFFCSICQEDDIPMENAFTIDPCNHRLCRDCAHDSIMVAVRSRQFPLVCPVCKADHALRSFKVRHNVSENPDLVETVEVAAVEDRGGELKKVRTRPSWLAGTLLRSGSLVETEKVGGLAMKRTKSLPVSGPGRRRKALTSLLEFGFWRDEEGSTEDGRGERTAEEDGKGLVEIPFPLAMQVLNDEEKDQLERLSFLTAIERDPNFSRCPHPTCDGVVYADPAVLTAARTALHRHPSAPRLRRSRTTPHLRPLGPAADAAPERHPRTLLRFRSLSLRRQPTAPPAVPAPRRVAVCPRCEHHWCLLCKAETAHHGMDCAEFAKWRRKHRGADAGFEEMVAREGWRRCPRCEVVTSKIDGCNKMRCEACHTIFCYLCGKRLGKTPYKHFRSIFSKCYKKLYDAPRPGILRAPGARLFGAAA
ncbi:translation termination inhibitor protein itt1 [Phlyctochytrium bullatum]|nr:translation termination inhibitor protein itt1 [Phlyctochytrium bullatum]